MRAVIFMKSGGEACSKGGQVFRTKGENLAWFDVANSKGRRRTGTKDTVVTRQLVANQKLLVANQLVERHLVACQFVERQIGRTTLVAWGNWSTVYWSQRTIGRPSIGRNEQLVDRLLVNLSMRPIDVQQIDMLSIDVGQIDMLSIDVRQIDMLSIDVRPVVGKSLTRRRLRTASIQLHNI